MVKIVIRKNHHKRIFNDEKVQFTFDEIMDISKQSMKDNNKLLKILATPPNIKFSDESEKPKNSKYIKQLQLNSELSQRVLDQQRQIPVLSNKLLDLSR